MNKTWLQLSLPTGTDISDGNSHDQGTVALRSASLIKLQITAETWKFLKSVATQDIKLPVIPNPDFL